MREPVFFGSEPDLGVYKTELDRYPRDPEFVPDWLREKVERWEVERAPEVALRIVELARQTLDLRAAMAHPKGGAWTWARLSMASDNYRLVSDFDYDRRPELTPAVTAQDCEDELRNFPREPGAIPDWMRPAT